VIGATAPTRRRPQASSRFRVERHPRLYREMTTADVRDPARPSTYTRGPKLILRKSSRSTQSRPAIGPQIRGSFLPKIRSMR